MDNIDKEVRDWPNGCTAYETRTYRVIDASDTICLKCNRAFDSSVLINGNRTILYCSSCHTLEEVIQLFKKETA